MALRLSDALRNFILQHGSVADALAGGELRIYSGTQPSTANAAPTGTLLATITKGSASRTAEVIASGSVELATGASGTVDSIAIDSVELLDDPVAFNTSLAQTAIDVATAINNSQSVPDYRAVASSTTVAIFAQRTAGTDANGLVVVSTATTITTNDVNMASGVDSANGLDLGLATAGTITKRANQSWSGAAVATGTAGWFRFLGAVADGGGADALEVEIRMDGAIATSGAEMNIPNLSIASSAVQTITAFQVSMPAG